MKCNIERRPYTVFGYKGKQVRDNIHARDVARFIECFIANPRCGEVYNIGGGRANSCSVLEALSLVEQLTGNPQEYSYDENNRIGDHMCYISDLSKMREHYPNWDITVSLNKIFEMIVQGELARIAMPSN